MNCCKSFLYSRFYHNTMWKSTSQNSPSLKRIYPLYHLNVQCFRWWKTSVKSKQIAFLERVIRRGIIALVLKNSEQCSKDPIHLLLPHPRTNEKKIVVIVAIIAISKIDIGPRNSITFVNTFNNDFLHQESSSPKVALNQLYIDEEEETNKRLHDAGAWNPW